mmetsp:Transcript_3331/g.20789  ORF Transcript_3331/g.20789 Transcript_3331/m.20789 type:complete len:113 (-) Transcript_3331:839-1177(-)
MHRRREERRRSWAPNQTSRNARLESVTRSKHGPSLVRRQRSSDECLERAPSRRHGAGGWECKSIDVHAQSKVTRCLVKEDFENVHIHTRLCEAARSCFDPVTSQEETGLPIL